MCVCICVCTHVPPHTIEGHNISSLTHNVDSGNQIQVIGFRSKHPYHLVYLIGLTC